MPAPRVISVPAAPVANVSAATETSAPSAEETAAANDAARSAQRSENLLRRDRSIFGTVKTGLRGLLTQTTDAKQRKTLLGE